MLVTMKEILDRASAENYAVAAPNVHTELNARSFVEAAEEMNAPLIIDFNFKCNPDIDLMGKILCDIAEKASVPVAVNLDHGAEYWKIVSAIRAGFTSVMVDRSSEPFEKNVEETAEIVKIAHAVGVSVEAELGHVGQADQYATDRDAALTSVKDAMSFIEQTGVDCLAIAIGTAHGAYPKGYKPYLDFDRLKEIKDATGGFPLVLHGSSGTAEEDLYRVCRMGINKVNVAYDMCRACCDTILEADWSGSNAYKFWDTLREAPKATLKHLIEVYGSDNKAWVPEHGSLRKLSEQDRVGTE
ncbi:class II fructose-bisphosphate aldolase [uncultured Enorma sp.]|uniref:class II fructose-bisphosphate aldolase n=1 Tax=uncultured Enorma sp. TaxID=1714346 RepID=UPI0028048ADA|nr:class II fructose-bisphosphate aldolase [uncultured Enorma sp.]